jgi:hypothetical protein
MKAKTLHRSLLAAEVLLVTAGFLIGTFGNTDLVKRTIAPEAWHGQVAFQNVLRDIPASPETRGYRTLNQALTSYGKEVGWTFNGRPVEALRAQKYINKHNVVGGDSVLNIIMDNGQELNVPISDLRRHLDDATNNSTYPVAILLFALGIALLLVQHYIENERKTNAEP